MENKELVKVLWVDDNPKLLVELPREAYTKGIYLDGHSCWEEAERALLSNFDDYDAVILDAKCKLKKSDNANAQSFLVNAIGNLRDICAERGRKLHWYVLSMGGVEVGNINDSIPLERKTWDGDWENDKLNTDHRPYYLKTDAETQALYARIKRQLSLSKRTELRTYVYRDVFRALESCNIDPDAGRLLEDLLLSIHYPATKGISDRHLTYAIRKIIEYIYRAMISKWGLLPQELINRGKINLFNSGLIISGKDVREGGPNGKVILRANGSVVDDIAGQNLRNMVNSVGDYVHTQGEEDNTFSQNLLNHFAITANSPYLIKSYALQLCDILMQIEDIVNKHPDVNKNKEIWETIQEL